MKNNKFLLVLAVALLFVVSFFSFQQWRKNQQLLEINSVLAETLAATRYLAENEHNLGTLLKNCLNNNNCDSQEIAIELVRLRSEKETLISKLKELEEEFNNLRDSQ